jgi:hypothetical protein
MPLRLTPEVERLWWEWFRAGYNGTDLRDVIKYIRRQISLGKRNEGALKLTNLIQRSEAGFIGFDQDLGLSRARANLSVDKRLEPAPGESSVESRASSASSEPGPSAGPRPSTVDPRPVLSEQLKKLRDAAR